MKQARPKLTLRWQNGLLLAGVIGLAVVPLAVVKGTYLGSDGQAQEAIQQLHPTYKPWFSSVFTPPSKEIESLLFASQAALGAGVFGYVLGRYQARNPAQLQLKPENLAQPVQHESSD